MGLTERIWTLAEWAKHLRAAADKQFRGELKKQFTRAALIGEREGKLNATTRMRRRSGRLAQSIRGSVRGDGATIALHLRAGGGSGRAELKYAGIQERGGVVSPRRGSNLVIPLDKARTAAGGLRAEFAAVPSLRAVPGLFVLKTNGKAFLVRKRGKNGLDFLFLLRRGSVKIRPKLYLMDGIKAAQKGLPPALEKLVRISTGERA